MFSAALTAPRIRLNRHYPYSPTRETSFLNASADMKDRISLSSTSKMINTPKFGELSRQDALSFLEKHSAASLKSTISDVSFSPGSLEKVNSVAPNQGIILVCKHQDPADTLVGLNFSKNLNRKTSFFIDSGYFTKESNGDMWQAAGAMPVVRGGNNANLNQHLIKAASTPGSALILSPEGQLSFLSDKLLPFQKGIGEIARALNKKPVQVFPVIFEYKYTGDRQLTFQAFQVELDRLRQKSGEALPPSPESSLENQVLHVYQNRVTQNFPELTIPFSARQTHQLIESTIQNFEKELLGRSSNNPNLITRLNKVMGVLLQQKMQNTTTEAAEMTKAHFLKTRTLMMMLCFPDLAKLGSGKVSLETLGSMIQWLKYDLFDDFVPEIQDTTRSVTIKIGDPVPTSEATEPLQFTELIRKQMLALLKPPKQSAFKL